MKKFSLVIPFYNEAPSIPTVTSRVVECAKRRGLTPKVFELVVVENGSRDNSGEVLRELLQGEHKDYLRVVTIEINLGYGHGIYTGLKSCESTITGWTHGDEQTDPEDAFKAFDIIQANQKPTLVKGVRSGRSLPERVITRGHSLIASLILFKRFREINAQPKIFPAALLETFDCPPKDFALDIYSVIKAKEARYKVAEIPVEFPERPHGLSSWAGTFRSKMKHILNMIRYILMYRFGLEKRYESN